MKSIRKAVVLAISALPLLCADVTIRLKTEMKSPMPVAMPANMPHEIYMKGNKGAESFGGQITIMDFAKREITISSTRRTGNTRPFRPRRSAARGIREEQSGIPKHRTQGDDPGRANRGNRDHLFNGDGDAYRPAGSAFDDEGADHEDSNPGMECPSRRNSAGA